ncbi:MAG: YHYH protein [Bacteroidota bacterium]|nr:YHYH protein [Bacteroidota bacterium]
MKSKLIILISAFTLSGMVIKAQLSPVIVAWLQNNTTTGRHYINGNPTPIVDADLANCQTVQYSASWVYVSTKGIPAYISGPYLDGNPSNATNQNAIFKFPLAPVQNTSTPISTTGGNIGLFINGVALFDYRDGVSWQNSTGSLKGGPLGGMGDNVWNRDAIVGERLGFDCSKGHPAMGNYHHHQNPSAFKFDLTVISTVCVIYNSDGLYAIDSMQHSPLIGFAYDGFPIYGAYGYKNANGTGGVARIKSSYTLRSITVRTTYAGSTVAVTPGPAVSGTYPLGYFKEDYQYNATSTLTPDYLDDHNGRFCVTPEYPGGTYCYFATVTNAWNSAYPYVVGPTFYGTKVVAKVTSISESTTTYTVATGIGKNAIKDFNVMVFPNPASDMIMVQLNNLTKENVNIELYDMTGKLIQKSMVYQGSTTAYIDLKTVYNGQYIVRISDGNAVLSKKILVDR